MKRQSPGDWKRKAEGVQWPDIWAWLAEIRDTYDLWGYITLHPPLPSREHKEYGVLSVKLVRRGEGREMVVHTRYMSLPSPSRARAEDIALQAVSSLAQQLDRESWEAERGAGGGEASIW